MGEKSRDDLEAARERERELFEMFYQSNTTLIHVVDYYEAELKKEKEKNAELLQFKTPRKVQTVKLRILPDDTLEVSGELESDEADDRLLSTRAAAKQLCISERTLRRKVDKGEIKAERNGKGGNLRFRQGELDRYLRRY